MLSCLSCLAVSHAALSCATLALRLMLSPLSHAWLSPSRLVRTAPPEAPGSPPPSTEVTSTHSQNAHTRMLIDEGSPSIAPACLRTAWHHPAECMRVQALCVLFPDCSELTVLHLSLSLFLTHTRSLFFTQTHTLSPTLGLPHGPKP